MMMLGILLQIMMLVQGIPALPNQGGTITGLVLSESLRPAAGVRIAAMVQPENPADIASAASLVSIAETDEAGRFQLENVPQGRYYVMAGRVENPTYYPGTLDITAGKIVAVAAGRTVAAVNFVIKDISDRGVESINAMVRIPIRVHVEDGVRIPVFSERGKVVVRLTLMADGSSTGMPLGAPTATLPVAIGEYRVSVENLPDGYALSALSYGRINLMKDTLKVTLDDFPKPGTGEKIFLLPTQGGVLIQRRISSSVPSTQNGFGQSASPGLISGSITSNIDLAVSLAVTPLPPPIQSGVRVQGKVESSGQQEVYMSGRPGILYNDGSFEFRDVPAGRYLVALFDAYSAARQLGAVISVGNRDVDDLELQDTSALPASVLEPLPNSANPASDVSAANPQLHSVHGHVVDAKTQRPVAGIITFAGYSRIITNSLPADGEFEIPNLFPGGYNLKIETFDRGVLSQSFVVGDADVDLHLSVP